MSSILEPLAPLVPELVDAAKVLIPALLAFALAALKRRTTQLQIVKGAVATVERENWEDCDVSKKARAVELVSQRTGSFTRMHPKRVGQLVERVLPEVKASLPPPPASSADRRSVEVELKLK